MFVRVPSEFIIINSKMEEKYTSNIYNEYKTRNILSLAERVEVIREYDRHLTRPSLQSLAQRFECSSKQIKNILINRKSILESSRVGGDAGQQKDLSNNTGDLWQKRQEKIAFLGKVMYEYIQRILYANYNIDEQKFRQKALQIKECIAVENFQPTNAWLEHFKVTYGIPAFDLDSLRNNVVITEVKRPYFTAIDMIQYVSRMEQASGLKESNRQTPAERFPKADSIPNNRFHSDENRSSLEPKIIYEIHDEEEDDIELKKLNFKEATPKMPVQNNVAVKRQTNSPFPDITTVDEALLHVRALEEYAMLHDNFRAIGLLTQLEQIFLKKDKKE